MVRLIDADAIVKDWSRYDPDRRFTMEGILIAIEIRPIVDAVEVVRCKNCKFYSDDDQGANPEWHLCTRTQAYRTTDDYCSRAERREE